MYRVYRIANRNNIPYISFSRSRINEIARTDATVRRRGKTERFKQLCIETNQSLLRRISL